MHNLVTTKLLSKIHFNEWKFSQNVKSVDDLGFIFSADIFKWKVEKGIEDALKDATLGSRAPDVPVYDVSTKKIINMLSKSKQGRPLVLNFGSCS